MEIRRKTLEQITETNANDSIEYFLERLREGDIDCDIDGNLNCKYDDTNEAEVD